MRMLPVLMAATLAGLGTLAAAASEISLPRSPKLFARVDLNADGKITLPEFKPRADLRFMGADGNGDGAVTSAEIEATFRKYIERRRDRIMSAMDADGDGTITRTELDNHVATMFNGADTDKDGGLTLEEARNFKTASLRRQNARPAGD
jgi:Ca2+-binding EF-hand superfamily protein